MGNSCLGDCIGNPRPADCGLLRQIVLIRNPKHVTLGGGEAHCYIGPPNMLVTFDYTLVSLKSI